MPRVVLEVGPSVALLHVVDSHGVGAQVTVLASEAVVPHLVIKIVNKHLLKKNAIKLRKLASSFMTSHLKLKNS